MIVTRSRTVAGVASTADFLYGVNDKNQTVAVPIEDARGVGINVKDYGAVIGGAADCTSAVAAAITAALAAGNKTVFFPAGEYLFNGGATSSDGYKNGVLVPFGTVNADPADAIVLEGEAGTVFKCGSDDMVLVRVSRNCVTVRNITLDANGKTNVILCGIVPESMTQTTTLTSNSACTLENVNRIGGAGVTGIAMQPGPHVGGADSGGFYHNVYGGWSNFIGGGRHIHLRKSVDWATNPNYTTRTNFYGQRLLRGNVGYQFDDASEIGLYGCNEELIANGTTPLATPTARYISADCANIWFYGGYSEGCTESFDAFANNVYSWGYIPASGGLTDWRTYATAWADGQYESAPWTPVVASSGGGAQGAATSTGRVTRDGKIVHVTAQISAAKGTLAAGNLSISGLPFVADSGWTGADFQGLPVTKMDGITLGTNFVGLVAYVSGATLTMRKLHGSGAGMGNLTLSDCADPIVFTVQGWYKAA